MRFYKNKQSEMLNMVAMLLKNEKEAVSAKVPALKDFISEFIEKHDKVQALKHWNPNAILHETLQKKSAKEAFAEVILKLLSVVRAANYRNKNKPAAEIHYTLWGLKKLAAADLCKVYVDAANKIKKIKNVAYYGLSPADLRDAQAYYKEFAVIKNAPAKRKRDVATKNKKLNDGIKECIDLLEHTIDPLMRLATEGNRDLSNKYKAKRTVFARGFGRPSDAEVAYRKSRMPKKNNAASI